MAPPARTHGLAGPSAIGYSSNGSLFESSCRLRSGNPGQAGGREILVGASAPVNRRTS